MSAPGLLIANEGADGSGKKTQTRLLCDRLTSEGFHVARFSFPTYREDPVADCIRMMLRERKDEWNARPWESKAVLYAANRKQWAGALEAALARPGTVAVCDRYVPSNQAHMAAISEHEAVWEERIAWVGHLEYEMMGLPRPDIVLLNTMPSSVAQQLMERRGTRDAHEEDVSYLERVVWCFLRLAERAPDVWHHIPADVDGRVQSPAEVHARVWEVLIAHPTWQHLEAARAAARAR